jgi:hypothetical protein
MNKSAEGNGKCIGNSRGARDGIPGKFYELINFIYFKRYYFRRLKFIHC